MKLSIVSTEVDRVSLSQICSPLVSHTHIRSFSGSHTCKQKQNNSTEALCENTSCSSHTACPAVHQELPNNALMLSCHVSSLTKRNFPVSCYEKKKATKFLTSSKYYCMSWFQLNLSCKPPGLLLVLFYSTLVGFYNNCACIWIHLHNNPMLKKKLTLTHCFLVNDWRSKAGITNDGDLHVQVCVAFQSFGTLIWMFVCRVHRASSIPRPPHATHVRE